LKTVPFKPKSSLVTEVADALRAVTQLDGRIDPPTWLNDDTLPPASEFFACASGLLHLPSGEIYPPTPKYFGLSASEVVFDPDAKEPVKWLAFLFELFDDDQQAIELLQEWFGYSLAPDTSQQKILLIVGPKRSGKGTIARVLKKLLGSASVAGPTMSSLGETFGLEPLIPKSLAIVSDARIGPRTDKSAIVERLLSISGEDQMTIARKFIAAWHGQLQTRFVILTNELPALADGSGALAGRFIALLLTQTFFGREDRALTDKLLTELPGILNWAIEGYRRLRKRGRFIVPDSAQEAIDDIETLGAPVKAFIRERCVTDPRVWVTVDDLWSAWKSWSDKEGSSDHVWTKQWFGRNLRSAEPRVIAKKIPKPKTKGKDGKTIAVMETKDEWVLAYMGIDLMPEPVPF
jgi:putative DNA primase/helicase